MGDLTPSTPTDHSNDQMSDMGIILYKNVFISIIQNLTHIQTLHTEYTEQQMCAHL